MENLDVNNVESVSGGVILGPRRYSYEPDRAKEEVESLIKEGGYTREELIDKLTKAYNLECEVYSRLHSSNRSYIHQLLMALGVH